MVPTYLVTGGAGFIGSNFILYMLQKYRDIRIINVDKLTYAGNLDNLASISGDGRHLLVREDICDKESMRNLFLHYQPAYVVNFAAETHVDRSIESPDLFASTNVMGTVSLLNVAEETWRSPEGKGYGDHRYLQVSTDEVYGSLSLENREELFHEETPLNPHSPYSASKAAADVFVLAYGDTFGLPVNITRCSNNYGPHQYPEKLIPLMIHNALNHEYLPVYGDGENVRDWLYVEDHCKAIDMVLDKGVLGEVYNIGGHNERSNITIVEIILDFINKHVDSTVNESLIRFVTDRKGHDRRYGIDPSKIKRDLGWFPETCFEDGISKTIQWYLDNPEWVKNIVERSREDGDKSHDDNH